MVVNVSPSHPHPTLYTEPPRSSETSAESPVCLLPGLSASCHYSSYIIFIIFAFLFRLLSFSPLYIPSLIFHLSSALYDQKSKPNSTKHCELLSQSREESSGWSGDVVLIQLLSRVRLFATPWTAANQASLSFTVSQSLLKLMSIKLVMPSNHLILCHPLLLRLQSFPPSGSFQMSQLFASGGRSTAA